MISAGWNLNDIEDDPVKIARWNKYCKTETFWGYKYGPAVGKISYIFKGDGKASLEFGNCFTRGMAKVYLNKDLIASTRGENTEKVFAYKKGDILMIKEVDTGIFIIHSLKISCTGKVASPEKYFAA